MRIDEKKRILKQNEKHWHEQCQKKSRNWTHMDAKRAIHAGTQLHKQIYYPNRSLPEEVQKPVRPQVVNDDVVAVLIRKQRDEKKHVIILNMCDATKPMGDLVDGNTTQEQHLCLCSNLHVHLQQAAQKTINFYNVHGPDDGKQNAVQPRIVSMINMDVYFCRNPEYEMITGGPDDPPITVISAAIPDMKKYFTVTLPANLSGVVETKQVKWRPTDVFSYNHALIGHLLSTIEDVAYRISCVNNDRAVDIQNVEVILSAWGCGRGQHEPQTMAEIFKQHLQSKHSDFFPQVTFAITGDTDTNYNYKIFHRVLHDTP